MSWFSIFDVVECIVFFYASYNFIVLLDGFFWGLNRTLTYDSSLVYYNSCFVSVYVEVHARRLHALKALTYASTSNSEISSKVYEIVFGILDKVCSLLH